MLDRILVKGYKFLSFPKNIDKSISKSESKVLSGSQRCSQRFDYSKQSATDVLKTTSKGVI